MGQIQSHARSLALRYRYRRHLEEVRQVRFVPSPAALAAVSFVALVTMWYHLRPLSQELDYERHRRDTRKRREGTLILQMLLLDPDDHEIDSAAPVPLEFAPPGFDQVDEDGRVMTVAKEDRIVRPVNRMRHLDIERWGTALEQGYAHTNSEHMKDVAHFMARKALDTELLINGRVGVHEDNNSSS